MVATSVYCNTPSPDWASFRAKYNREYWERAENSDSGETIYIDTRWVVLWRTEDEKVPLARVQDCHRMLQLIFNQQNTEEIAKIPQNSRHPWRERLGNPNISFLPLDSSDLSVEYRRVSSDLDGQAPVSDAAVRGDRVEGVLNLYIGNTGGGSILGQAELNSNVAYGLHSAIGGYNIFGPLQGYHLGKTMAHEVGHSLGLVHTFSDTACDGFSPYLDVPEQIAPNFDTALIEVGAGQYDQVGDNRYKDRLNGTTFSCLDEQANPSTAPNEMGINVMDYGKDEVSVMFTHNQALMMRTYLWSGDNNTLTLRDKDYVSMSSGGQELTAQAEETESSSSSGLSTGAIIGIVVGAVVVVLLIAFFFYWKSRHPSSAKHYKRAESTAYKKRYDYSTL